MAQVFAALRRAASSATKVVRVEKKNINTFKALMVKGDAPGHSNLVGWGVPRQGVGEARPADSSAKEPKLALPGLWEHRDSEDQRCGPVRRQDAFEPLSRVFAAGMPMGREVSASAVVETMAPPPTLDHLMVRFVTRLAWGGTRDRGAAKLSFGDGPLAGGTLTVTESEGALSLELELPDALLAERWRERLAERLEGVGLRIESFEVG